MSRSQAKGNRKGTRPGVISHEMMRDRLEEFRSETGYPLEVRGGDVDESPFVYRKLDEVVRAHEATETIRVTHRLLPVVVCMAGSDVFDPFKD
jgi:tRNA-splicing ligase RtcB